MGSGGTEWDSNDTFDTDRLNQKTTFVGTGDQIDDMRDDLGAGQSAYCITSNSTHTADKYSTRNSGNTAWTTPSINATAVASDPAVAMTPGTGFTANVRFYRYLTIPSDEKFYIITQMDVIKFIGSGNTICGVDIIDADPFGFGKLVALSNVIDMTGGSLNDVFSSTIVSSNIIPGGTLVGIWQNSDTANTCNGNGDDSTPLSGDQSTETYNNTPDYAYKGASVTSQQECGVRIYYIGYS